MAPFIFSAAIFTAAAFSTLGLAKPSVLESVIKSYSTSTGLTLSTPPYEIGSNATLTPFTISINDSDIEELSSHLKLFKTPRETYENSDVGWKYGVPKSWLVDAVDYWQNTFDWRQEEEKLNSIPQFKLELTDDDGESYSVHLSALFSAKIDAIPIIMTHGWPDTWTIYMPILEKLQAQYNSTPDEMPYHIIVPSMIGTGFSSSTPLTKPFYTPDNARIWNKLMIALGFGEKGYIAHGCDVGTMVSEYMLAYDECKGAHVDLWWGSPAYNATTELPANAMEEATLERVTYTTQWGTGNVKIHSDRSSTAGFAIGNNPISILTWIGERMVLWSDPNAQLSFDVIVPNAAVYWFTNTYATSYWCYAQFRSLTNDTLPGFPESTGKPKAFSWFPEDIANPPSAFFYDNNSTYTYFYQHDAGGHFAPTEQPDALWADLEDFVSKVWT